jgi:hypothetical protein
LEDNLTYSSGGLVIVHEHHFTTAEQPISVSKDHATAQGLGGSGDALDHAAFTGFKDFKGIPTQGRRPGILGKGSLETKQ